MASDAHAHPFDLSRLDPSAESLRLALGISCAASAWREEEFLFNEALAATDSPPIALCFAVHPQLPAVARAYPLEERDASADGSIATEDHDPGTALAFLGRLVAEGRVRAIGEAGFDLFDAGFRETENEQEGLFRAQLELALSASLPMVLHLRRAMHKAFAYSRKLSRLPAVIFHSYSGTLREAGDLLKRGVNAYFSFGTPIRLNHKRAMEACAALPADRLLFETDAPYQPPRGKDRSSWSDLALVLETAAALRSAASSAVRTGRELEEMSDGNFRRAYGLD